MALSRRILMLAPQLGYGGAEQAFVRIANFLSRHRQVTVALFTESYGSDHYAQETMDLECPVILLDDYTVANRLTRWRQRISRLAALKAEHNVAISFLSGPNLLNALTSDAGGTIISERGSKRFDHGTQTWARIANRILDPVIYRRADAIVAVSRGVASELREGRNEAIRRKIFAIEGGIISEQLLFAAAEQVDPGFEVLAKFGTIAAIGRLHPTKGYDRLIDFFAEVRKRNPIARLLLVGDGPMKMELITRARCQGLSYVDGVPDPELPEDVIFAGYRRQPIRFLKLARVFAFTSVTEGLGNALIEALAADIPIVAADCPYGPRSILSDQAIEGYFSGHRKALYPEKVDAGLLMPPVNDASAAALWSKSLLNAISKPLQHRSSYLTGKLWRFDIERNGPAWLDLCDRYSSDGLSSRIHKE